MTEVDKTRIKPINVDTTNGKQQISKAKVSNGNSSRGNTTELPAGHDPNRPVNVSWSKIRQERKDKQCCSELGYAMYKEWDNNGRPQEYKTSSGDTYWNIAEMVKEGGHYPDKSIPDIVKEIKSLNNIPHSSSTLLPNKRIKLFNDEEANRYNTSTVENKVQDRDINNTYLESTHKNTPSSLEAANEIKNSSVVTTGDSSPGSVSAQKLDNVGVRTDGKDSPASATGTLEMKDVSVLSRGDNSPAKGTSYGKADNVKVMSEGNKSDATLEGQDVSNSYVNTKGNNSTSTLDSSYNGDIKNTTVEVHGKGSTAKVSGSTFGDTDVVVNQDSRLGHTEVNTGKGNNVVTENVTGGMTTGNYDGGWSTDIVTENIKTTGNQRTIALGGGSDEANINFSNGADNNKISLLGDSTLMDVSSDTYNVDFSRGKNNSVIVNTIPNHWGPTAKNDTLVLQGSGFRISDIDNIPGAKYLVEDDNGNKAYIGEKVSKLIIKNSDGQTTYQKDL